MTRDEALSILDDLDNCDRSVSEWEADFLDSMLKQSERPGWSPTEKQAAILERMKGKYL
jgi:hypothetical protein